MLRLQTKIIYVVGGQKPNTVKFNLPDGSLNSDQAGC